MSDKTLMQQAAAQMQSAGTEEVLKLKFGHTLTLDQVKQRRWKRLTKPVGAADELHRKRHAAAAKGCGLLMDNATIIYGGDK